MSGNNRFYGSASALLVMPQTRCFWPFHFTSGSRAAILAVAKAWTGLPESRLRKWRVPAEDMMELQYLTSSADAVLAIVMKTDRTAANTAWCGSVFESLKAKMRFIKSRYFHTPPLDAADYTALFLKTEEPAQTAARSADFPVEAGVAYSGGHTIEISTICPPLDTETEMRSPLRVQIRYGVLAEEGPYRIPAPPERGDDLPFVRTTRRKREPFDFEGYPGQTAYFCLRACTSGGKNGPFGPWGPVLSVRVPHVRGVRQELSRWQGGALNNT